MSEQAVKIDHRVVIFSKDGLYGSIGFWSSGQRHFVGSCDPRTRPSIYEREFTHLADAEASFADHIKVTRDRGWKLVYSGPASVG